jgi:hypothetical protein
LYALLTGPTRPAVALRRLSSPVVAKPVGAWLLATGLLVLYFLVMPGFSVERWVTALVFAALFVVAVESLRRQIVREFPVVDPAAT